MRNVAPAKDLLDDLLDVVNVDDLNVVLDGRRDVVLDVGAHTPGNEDALDAGAVCREQLFFQSSDGQDWDTECGATLVTSSCHDLALSGCSPCPASVISPVMAKSDGRPCLVNRLMKADSRAVPALGPSA